LDTGFSLALAEGVRVLVVLTAAADLVPTAFLALAAAETPVTAVLAVPFLVTFFAGVVFFTGFLVVVPAFLAEDAYFLVVEAGLGVVRLVFGAAVVVATLALDLVTGRAGVFLVEDFEVLDGGAVAFLEAGFAELLLAGVAFSFAASLRPFGASLTFPDGPFGRTKVPFSAPWVMALLSWLAAVALR